MKTGGRKGRKKKNVLTEDWTCIEDEDYTEDQSEEQYERDLSDREISKRNSEYLSMFQEELESKGLDGNEVRRHLDNAGIFLNGFLLQSEEVGMKSGISRIGDFLGDYCIRKGLCSTPENISSTAESLKKFYKSMLHRHIISDDDWVYLRDRIRDGMKGWQQDCALYNLTYDEDIPF